MEHKWPIVQHHLKNTNINWVQASKVWTHHLVSNQNSIKNEVALPGCSAKSFVYSLKTIHDATFQFLSSIKLWCDSHINTHNA